MENQYTYQWLTAEFNLSTYGQVKIESYVNNLYPTENEELYHVIEQIFKKFLTDLFYLPWLSNRIGTHFGFRYGNKNQHECTCDYNNIDSDEHQCDEYSHDDTNITQNFGEF